MSPSEWSRLRPYRFLDCDLDLPPLAAGEHLRTTIIRDGVAKNVPDYATVRLGVLLIVLTY